MQEDIRPLKDFAKLWDWWGFLGWVLLVFLAVSLTILAFRLLKKKGSGGRNVVPSGPPRPPHEIALESLARLENSDLLKKREIKLFYSELAGIFRLYLGACFQIDTLDRTTWEIDQLLRNTGVSLLITGRIREVLEEADLVKFAKYLPPVEAPLKTLEQARALIKETTPQAVAAD